jgi:hypothetical protein
MKTTREHAVEITLANFDQAVDEGIDQLALDVANMTDPVEIERRMHLFNEQIIARLAELMPGSLVTH